MAANNRIFYATQAVYLMPANSDLSNDYGSFYRPKGVQSVGITTNFTLEQVFQLGQLDLYDQVEDVPEIEVTLNKVIDGTLPLYLMCVGGEAGYTGANGKGLAEIANNRVHVRLALFSDTQSAASGTARDYVDCSGMYLSSVSYTFPVDGNATEDVTLVGNSKVWNSAPTYGGTISDHGFGNESTAETSPATARRYKFSYAQSALPTGAGGIPIPTGGSRTVPYLQSVTLSTDLGREAINELGRMAPYYRYATFPVEVTSEFEVIGADGDKINANDFTSYGIGTCADSYTNLTNKTVSITVCGTGAGESLNVDLGDKNKLTSVNYTGGDTGGGNATITYSFQTFNAFKVTVSGATFTTEETVA
jgi:hypothetical protein